MGFALKLAKVEKTARTKTDSELTIHTWRRAESGTNAMANFITRAKNWRTMALISALVALVATGGMLWHVGAFEGRSLCCAGRQPRPPHRVRSRRTGLGR